MNGFATLPQEDSNPSFDEIPPPGVDDEYDSRVEPTLANIFGGKSSIYLQIEDPIKEPVREPIVQPIAEPILSKPIFSEPILADPILADPILAKPILAKPILADPMSPPISNSVSKPRKRVHFNDNITIYDDDLDVTITTVRYQRPLLTTPAFTHAESSCCLTMNAYYVPFVLPS